MWLFFYIIYSYTKAQDYERLDGVGHTWVDNYCLDTLRKTGPI
jgi:hypothetical protein